MTKKPTSSSRKGGRLLSEEDHTLWETTTGSVKPMRLKSRVHEGAKKAELPEVSSVARSGKVEPRRPAMAPYVPPAPPLKTSPQLAGFDKRQAKKLRSGRRDIERRIDLHGMRQREAHGALRRFLFSCHAAGLRNVLVITGKGTPRRRDDTEQWGREETGVLKRQVPLWLNEPELRAIVVSYTAAAIQHGGDGALYVQLRRQERVG